VQSPAERSYRVSHQAPLDPEELPVNSLRSSSNSFIGGRRQRAEGSKPKLAAVRQMTKNDGA
jgi:hypothetical protein